MAGDRLPRCDPTDYTLEPGFSTDGTFDPKAVTALKQSFIEMGLLKEIPDDKVMFTTQFVPVKTGM